MQSFYLSPSAAISLVLLFYRAIHLLADLGWFRYSTSLPRFSADSAKFPSALAESDRQRKSQNQSEPNHVRELMERPVLSSSSFDRNI